ncbi:hypothetical protein D9V80_01055 [Buchnera aphidicola (Thelaxes californica)]|uniref:Uncharacterized protein n=1 Tax=Buchnera aphidicola (Thelaxes californica) TaxID=1315998 RepID=A0A4D6YAC5_9GAMM|nr:YciC family protein [Buchnera aphidicola]QCI26747.1 hypothetical protein D9V80_01055 [Buchnera aphidicola (Thelaxes californica)]
MRFTAQQLYRDSRNFISNTFFMLLLISVITSIFGIGLESICSMNTSQLQNFYINHIHTRFSFSEFIQESNVLQKKLFIQLTLSNWLITLIESTFLLNTVMCFTKNVIEQQENKIFQLMIQVIKKFPTTITLITLTNICIQIGYMILIIPGILLSIRFSIAPIILLLDNKKIIECLKLSSDISKKYFLYIILPIIVCFLFKILLIAICSNFNISNIKFNNCTLHIINNLCTSFLLVYLCRMYMLIHKK